MVITKPGGTGILALVIWGFKGVHQLDMFQVGVLLTSGVFCLFYILPYLQALQIDDATLVVPLMQLAPLYILFFSTFFLSEPLTPLQLMGFGLILISSLILSAEKFSLKIFKLRKSFWLMSLAMLMYAGIGLLFRYVVRENDFWTTVFYQNLGALMASIPLGVYMYKKSNLAKNLLRHKPVLGFIFLSNIIAAGAILSQSVALTTTSAPRVYIIEGTQPIIMLVMAVISSLWFPGIMKEDLAKETLGRKIFFSLIIFAGLFLIRS